MPTYTEQIESNKQVDIAHNLGWKDRMARFTLGGILLGVGVATIVVFNRPEWIVEGQQVPSWAYYVSLVSIYPFLTAMLGWDPVYRLIGYRSCGNSPDNPCGSLPYEVDAAMGHEPEPTNDAFHELGASRRKGASEKSK